MSALWEQLSFRNVAGDTWRPGGIELTRRALDWCAARHFFPREGIAVDMGCGAGATLNLLAGYGLKAVGIDSREEGHFSWATPRETLCIRADVTRPPLATACAALVVFECVLSLLPEPLAALQAAWRVLAPGGICMMRDITLRDDIPDVPPGGTSCLGHARRPGMWRELLCAAGLCVLCEKDCSHALSELAARLYWYGVLLSDDSSNRPFCATSASRRRYGYGLWITQKRTT